MSSKLSVFHVRNTGQKHITEFNKWSEICHIYTQHNLSPRFFDKSGKEVLKFNFYVKWLNYPLSVNSTDYLTARLKFWTAFRGKKQIKRLSYYHDRLIEKIEVLEGKSARPIGLSNVSILQQNF
jgi:hypothetical protein